MHYIKRVNLDHGKTKSGLLHGVCGTEPRCASFYVQIPTVRCGAVRCGAVRCGRARILVFENRTVRCGAEFVFFFMFIRLCESWCGLHPQESCGAVRCGARICILVMLRCDAMR